MVCRARVCSLRPGGGLPPLLFVVFSKTSPGKIDEADVSADVGSSLVCGCGVVLPGPDVLSGPNRRAVSHLDQLLQCA